MVHTLPAWTSKWRMATLFANIDEAELAARLGSCVRYDRRGNVVFYDNFEAPVIHWSDHSYISGSTYYLSTLNAETGSQSVCMAPDNTKNAIAGIRREFPLPPTTRLGFELSFMHAAKKLKTYVYLGIKTGSTVYVGTFTFDGNAEKLQIYTSAFDVDVATSLEIPLLYNCFNHMKCVVDWDTKKFVRILFNDEEYDISDYTMYSASDSASPRILIHIRTEVLEAASRLAYIDNFIITHNEP